MTNQPESEEIIKLIGDRFDQSDKKLETKINEVKIEIIQVKSDLNKEIAEVDFKLGKEIGKLTVDVGWIKWLFGGLLSFILILLSIIVTLLFKLVS